MDTANIRALASMSEAMWQETVIGHAQQADWFVYYIPDAMWRRAFVSKIPQQLGNRGFPDLVLVKGRRLLFRELKRVGGRLSTHQAQWRDRLLHAGADWAIWTPLDLDDIVIPTLWQEE